MAINKLVFKLRSTSSLMGAQDNMRLGFVLPFAEFAPGAEREKRNRETH